ncbi:MAG: DUF262 domain-containing protein, partial [Pseudomonadota bacterium]
EAMELLGDFAEAAEVQDTHFIGAIVLVENPDGKRLEIVDGQQRLTTLTILLAVLRDLESDRRRSQTLHNLIVASDGGTEPRWRLTLNHVDGPFFRAAIQATGATSAPLEEPAESDSQSRMARNAAAFRKELQAMSTDARRRLAETVMDRCVFVIVRVADRDAGYKVFRVLNTRGKEPSAHDIIKTDLFEKAGFTVDEAEQYARAWAEYEARLGGSAFDDLLRQIRFIYDRSAKGDVVAGFRRAITDKLNIRRFLSDTLPAYVEAYREISKGAVKLGSRSDEINDYLNRLRALEHHLWRAPALKYLVHRRHNASDAVDFFRNLERLGFAVQLIIHDRDQRTKRYRKVMDALDTERQMYTRSGPFSLSRDEHKKIAERLRGRFATFGQRRALALRLNAALAQGRTLPPEADATVEHVLPRNPETDSQWLNVWSNALVRRELCDTIGNLVLLPHSVNQEADRLGYFQKRDVYFAADTDPFALTEDIRPEDLWTPDTVRRRTERLANILCDEWGIKPNQGFFGGGG